MPRTARRRLDERFDGGHAFGVTEQGATLRFGGEGEAHAPPRAASVAGYKGRRDAALALKARQRAVRTRATQGPETPAQALARMLNIGETEAYHAVRNPYFGRFVQSKVSHQNRMAELDRMQTGRLAVGEQRGKTSRDLLGERLGFSREALGVRGKIAAGQEAGRQKRYKDYLAEQVADRASRERMATEKAEATAGSAAGKQAETRRVAAEKAKTAAVAAKDTARKEGLEREHKRLSGDRDKLVKRLEKLEDTAAKPGSTTQDKAHRDAAGEKLAEFDKGKKLDKAYEALQGFKPTAAAAPEDEPKAPGAEPATQPAATTQPAAPQFQTSAEAISAIKSGQFDLNAPGSEEVFLSLPPQVAEEVRSWLRQNGYLD